jgi:hypothetical protein
MALRLASTETTVISLKDGGHLEVVTDLSKRTFNKLVAAMPDNVDAGSRMTPTQGVTMTEALFDALVVGWSLDVPPTVENYLGLDMKAALEVDDALMEHFGKLTVGEPEAKKPKTSRSSSAKEIAPTTD